MYDENVRIFRIVGWKSGVAVRAVVRAVRAVRAGCCVASAGVRFFAVTGWAGFGWLMFEEMLRTFMARIFSRFNWTGGCRWLMCDEMSASFILLLGSPG